jgi:hypothetical protein
MTGNTSLLTGLLLWLWLAPMVPDQFIYTSPMGASNATSAPETDQPLGREQSG